MESESAGDERLIPRNGEAREVRWVYLGMLAVQERDGNNVPLVIYTRGRTMQGAAGIRGLLARSDNAKLAVGDSFVHDAPCWWVVQSSLSGLGFWGLWTHR